VKKFTRRQGDLAKRTHGSDNAFPFRHINSNDCVHEYLLMIGFARGSAVLPLPIQSPGLREHTQ
jgi:hypothetical protein